MYLERWFLLSLAGKQRRQWENALSLDFLHPLLIISDRIFEQCLESYSAQTFRTFHRSDSDFLRTKSYAFPPTISPPAVRIFYLVGVERSLLPNRIVPSSGRSGRAPATRIPRVSLRIIQRIRGEPSPVVGASSVRKRRYRFPILFQIPVRKIGAQRHVQVVS